ncbi:MAG: 30S ribosomal protein S20 [Pirellulaceae bacterium]|jgi:small subunit ribosomal protein S20|nr:30S ribosomal protein S20 [Pirellulaceae bacterium]
MPNTKSAKKRLRQNLERRARNRSARTALRTQVRKVRESVAAGAVDKAQDELRAATRRLDQAGAQRLIHPNKAARLKSRLSRLIKAAKTP